MARDIENIATELIEAILVVHRELGPGLLESTYQVCLAHELSQRSIEFQRELRLPIKFRGLLIEAGYRIDMLVDHRIIVENKSIQTIMPIHQAQLL